MLLTDAQVKRFWRDWSAACKAQGWTRADGLTAAQIDQHRRDLIERAGFRSLTAVDRGAGFGRVLAELGILLGQVKAAVESDHPEMDSGRRKRWVVSHRILPCLGVYLRDPEAYLASILRDKTEWYRQTEHYAVPLTLDELTDDPVIRTRPDGSLDEQPSHLDQIMMTLNRALHGYRRKAGHSIHEMCLEAGVQCDCKECTTPRAPARKPQPKTVPSSTPF